MKPSCLLLLLLSAGIAVAVETPANGEIPPVAAVDTPTRQVVEHDGQVFEMANRTRSGTVETDEYLLAGEKIGDWTQLVTIQRLTLKTPRSPDEYVRFFRERVTADGGSLEVVRQAPRACVFAVRFPKSERNDEQVVVCLAMSDPAQPQLLAVVQYAIKPARRPVEEVAAQLTSWKNRFVRQVAAAPGA